MDIEFEQEIRRSIHRGLREIEKDRVAREQVLRQAEKAILPELELRELKHAIKESQALHSRHFDSLFALYQLRQIVERDPTVNVHIEFHRGGT